MALKDLVSDLSNFRGRSQYDNLDTQIEEGVDFFPNDNASGFTPKTDLESLYKNNSELGAINKPDVPLDNKSQKPSDIPIVKSSNMHVDDIPAQSFNNESKAFGAHNSPFLSTPISTYVSGLEPPKNIPVTFRIQPNNSDNVDLTKFSSDFATIGGGVDKYAIITPLEDRTSAFGNGEISLPPADYSFQQITHNIPAITTRAAAKDGSIGLQNADYRSARNTGPFTINTSAYDIDWGSFETDGTYSGVNAIVNQTLLDNIDEKTAFKDKQFSNVPAGLGLQNVPSFKNYREVSDPDTVEYARQPFILRKVGSNWKDVFLELIGDNPSNGMGSFGAALDGLGILNGISMRIADKTRIFRYLISPSGIGFVAKQFVFQGLNPTLESKIYNPLSTLGIAGANDLLSGDVNGLLSAAASFLLPTHVERHFGGGRYEDVVPLNGFPDFMKPFLPSSVEALESQIPFGEAKFAYGSRIAMQSNPEIIEQRTVEAFGYSYTIGGKDLGTSLMFMNPNKYLFPISSAPKSIHNGRVSFTGGTDLAESDADKVRDKPGGTFNKETSQRKRGSLIKRHSTFAYDNLNKNNAYGTSVLVSPGEFNELNNSRGGAALENIFPEAAEVRLDKRLAGKTINDNIGSNSEKLVINSLPDLGLYKGTQNSSNVDKINMTPYGGGAEFERKMRDNPDYIKFRFKDKVNNKYIIFRAILEGISDSITPDYGEERYIGRPDKVYIYQGADRNISFGFSIYPKTKQELPVLMEKLNYLVGLCYPSYTTESERMKSPVMELTIGDMFTNASGILMGLTVSVEDTTTWEIDEGLQFPHFIKAQCEFRYIGDNILATTGKHYNLGWVPDGNISRFGEDDLGYSDLPHPNRKEGFYRNFFAGLDQAKYDAELIPTLRERTD